MSQIDRSLLAIFSGEQSEHLTAIRAALDGLTSDQQETRALAIGEVLRRLHTLKGAARAVGVEQTEALTHQAEEVLARFRENALQSAEEVVRALQRLADTAEDILAAAAAARPEPDISDLTDELTRLSGTAAPLQPAPSGSPALRDEEPVAAAPSSASEVLRIQERSLVDLMRNTSDLLIDPGGEATLEHMAQYVTRLEEIAAEWTRMRRATFKSTRPASQESPLRAEVECLTFMDTRLEALRRDARRLSEDLTHTIQSSRDKTAAVYEAACQIRMTPAESVFSAFGPMVRDLARQEGREVVFEADGMEVNADLLVLQGLKDAVMHLLRNALSHGIESPEERLRVGKPRDGRIRLYIRSRGDRLELVVEDDGRGIDYARVRRQARAQGMLRHDDEDIEEDDLKALILRPGFSTSAAVTGVSGRGMGLAIVEAAARRLHGTLAVQRGRSGGTSIMISVPLSISTEHVLLVGVGGYRFGVPCAYVESVARIQVSEVHKIDGKDAVFTEAGPVVLVNLATVLGLNSLREPDDTHLACAILDAEGRRMAFVVDELVNDREVTIKDTGLDGPHVGATAGAVPLEDGTVAVMLSVPVLFDMAGRSRPAPPQRQKRRPTRKRRILVADDSITTRSLERNILEANGYDVRVAVDGLEAFEMMRAETPDLVISDVSMPRMNGFQLLEQVRKHNALKKLPFILMTSLEKPEEQELGLSLGADAYLVKRKFDQRELLNIIRELV